jgi:uracil-DNA glycosylase
MSKAEAYAAMVADRKRCRACVGLTNPSEVDSGQHDSEHIGPWSRWQGNLDAKVMVVGQDWGTVKCLRDNLGVEPKGNPTCETLVDLVEELGVKIGLPQADSGQHVAFFTNGILCLKPDEGGLQGNVEKQWFANCGTLFLRRQIEILAPKVVIAVGLEPFRQTLASFSIKSGSTLRPYVTDAEGTLLPNGSRAFAVYHCGARGLNMNRSLQLQQADWRRIRRYLD